MGSIPLNCKKKNAIAAIAEKRIVEMANFDLLNPKTIGTVFARIN